MKAGAKSPLRQNFSSPRLKSGVAWLHVERGKVVNLDGEKPGMLRVAPLHCVPLTFPPHNEPLEVILTGLRPLHFYFPHLGFCALTPPCSWKVKEEERWVVSVNRLVQATGGTKKPDHSLFHKTWVVTSEPLNGCYMHIPGE